MSDSETSSVYATISINCITGGAFLVLFELWRNYNVEIYAPRLRTSKNLTIEKPRTSILGWFRQVWEVNDSDMLRMVGLDGYVFLRYMKMCAKIGGVCTALLVILLPVYYTSPGVDGVEGIGLFSMANIEAKGMRLWACWVFSYVFSLIFLYFIHKEYEHFAMVRKQFFIHGDAEIPLQKNYSIQVENIPKQYRSTEALRNFFESLFPGEVLYCNIAVSLNVVDKLVAERTAAVAGLENVIAAFEADPKHERPMLKLSKGKVAMCGGCCGGDEEVDGITFLTDQIAILNGEVASLQAVAVVAEEGNDYSDMNEVDSTGKSIRNPLIKAVSTTVVEMDKKINAFASDLKEKILVNDRVESSIVATATGFVTFKSRRAQVVACQVPILSERYPSVTAAPSPTPEDIIWDNIGVLPEYTKNVEYLTSVFFNSGLLFWGVVMAFIAAVSNLSNLATYLPFLNDLDSVSYAILEGQLPVILLIVFMMLIPMVMTYVAQCIEKRKTNSDVQMEVFKWFFMYQLANVYLILLAGSVFDSLEDAISDPASIINLIGTALPSVSVFFINYLLTNLLSGVPSVLLRLNNVLIFRAYRLLFNQKAMTRRTYVEGPLAVSGVDYGTTLPDFLYTLCVTQLYWVISPILLVISTLFFATSYIVWKYQYLYVVVRGYESGGVYWYGLYHYSMVGLMAGTVTMISYMGIKQGAIQTPLLLPLLFIIIYCWRYTEDKFKNLSLNLPYSAAVNVDTGRSDAHEEINMQPQQEILASFTEGFNKQPNLTNTDKAYPYPYRIDNTPLLNENGELNEVYHDEVPDGVDLAAIAHRYVRGAHDKDFVIHEQL